MCGIIALLGQQPSDVFQILFNGLQTLQNRGYDSAGICTLDPQTSTFTTRKCATDLSASGLDLLKAEKQSFGLARLGIGHNRWSTHGAKTNLNAHPHLDNKKQFALVHNGIIENYLELKTQLTAKGYTHVSETDSEVIVNLIACCYETTKDVNSAINQAVSQLRGTWALAIISTLQPDTLFVCKNGSPLLVGFKEMEGSASSGKHSIPSTIMVASEVAGFCNLVSQYVILDNHDIISLKLGEPFPDLHHKRHQAKNSGTWQASPEPYAHWMLKEIHEQPQSLLRAINCGGRIVAENMVKLGGLDMMPERLLEIDHLIIMACGTSLNAGLFGASWFRRLGGFRTVTTIDASEFKLWDLPPDRFGIIMISQSGETRDLVKVIELLKSQEKAATIIGVVNVTDSLIARESDCGVYLNASREVAVASTKSFTSQVVVLVLIAIWFAQKRKLNDRKRLHLIRDLCSISLQSENVIQQISVQCQQVAKLLSKSSNCFILGRDLLYPIALEGALKLKEIGYIHAEGFPAGSLKHGPFAIIGEKTPVILLIDQDSAREMSSTIEEICSRQAPVIVIATQSTDNIDKSKLAHYLPINADGELAPLLLVIAFQLISYYMGVEKGTNPDFPKNLAKVVTVDG